MRPYLSIIKDSFREALASRVLWVVLALITLLLLGFLPFSWVSSVAARLGVEDIRRFPDLVLELQQGKSPDATPLQKMLWDGVSKETRSTLASLEKRRGGPQEHRIFRRLTNDLNRLIEKEDFYDSALWKDVEVSERLAALLAKDDLSPELKMQRNRLALEAALPNQLRACPEQAFTFRYAIWDLTMIPPKTRADAESEIDKLLMLAIPLIIGFFGVSAAILVTAPIIPNMLSSGSLYVLLSKPVSRPWMFLAKFFGGCSFVLINVAYMVFGAILILGIRFQIWKPELLWVIPLFLFSFSIFYSISAVTGLIWRNAILAIGMTVIFWVLCTTLGIAQSVMEFFTVSTERIQTVLHDDERTFIYRANGDFAAWDPEEEVFATVLQTRGQRERYLPGSDSLGEYYDHDTESLARMERKWSQPSIYRNRKSMDWRKEKVPAPPNAVRLFLREGKPTVIANGGVYQIIDSIDDGKKLGDINLYGFVIPAPRKKNGNLLISEDLGKLTPRALGCYSPADDRIYVLDRGTLRALSMEESGSQNSSRFVVSAELSLGPDEVYQISAGNGGVALAGQVDGNHSLTVFDADLRELFVLQVDEKIEQLAVTQNGCWGFALLESDELFAFDLTAKGVRKRLPGKFTAVAVAKEALLTVNDAEMVAILSTDDLTVKERRRPQLGILKRLYRYVVNPLYLISPKPAELQKTMRYVLTGKTTQQIQGFGPPQTVEFNPWQPIYSNSIFIVIVLAVGCVYVYRQDF